MFLLMGSIALFCYNNAMAEVIHIVMIRDDLENIPQYTLPEGFSIRNFRAGEGRIWSEIGTAAGTLASIEIAQGRFDEEFLEPVEDMESRCFFVVENDTDRPIGTAMAWFAPEFEPGQNYGRIHWVSMIPEFQGRGLAKPMMTAVLNRLAKSHDKATLGTQTFRKAAVTLYLNLGFRPCFKNPTCPQAWKDLANELKHPALADYA